MKRVLLCGAIAFLALRLLVLYVVPGWSQITTDFPNYYTPAWAIWNGEPLTDLYDVLSFDTLKERAGIPNALASFNLYPPLNALVALPFAGFSPLAAKHGWTLLNMVTLLGVTLLVTRSTKAPFTHVALLALLGLDSLGNNFIFGQVYIVIALLLVMAMEWHRTRPAFAGVPVAVATLTKVFPGFLMLYFVVTRRWRALAWSGIFVALFTLLSLWLVGWEPHRIFFGEVLPRLVRGDILDPYNVHFNSLTTLLRRALVPEPELNPQPMFNAPMIYFFVRPAIGFSVLIITMLALQRNSSGERRSGSLVELGAIVTAATLIAPGLGTHHYFVLFPGVAALVHHWKDRPIRFVIAGVYALTCSNWMGAGAQFDSGMAMLLAFPRAVTVLLLWAAFMWALDVFALPKRPLGVGIGIALIAAGLSAASEQRAWARDERDGAVMADTMNTGLKTFPTVGTAGLTYSSFWPDGFRHPSAFGDGLVHELRGIVSGRLPGGQAIVWSGAAEPALGPASVVAIRHDDRGWVIVERGATDTAWRELTRRPGPLHDPAISFDGSHVAFAEWADGRYRLSQWQRSDGTVRVLVSGSSDIRYPAYSPSGRWFFYADKSSGNWDVVRLSLRDGRREVQTASEANDFMPAVSADERTLYFASDRRRGYRYTGIYRIELK